MRTYAAAWRRWVGAVVLALGFPCVCGPAAAAQLELSGPAFGVTWRVRLVDPPDAPSAESLGAEIDALLREIDAGVSAWRDDSEIARFNASDSTAWQTVSPATARVVEASLALHRLSGGAFDPTVAPLVALWGFGPAPQRSAPPSPEEIAALLPRLGAGRVSARETPPALRKARPDVALDVTAVTEGFAVDAIAGRLAERGVTRALVDLGGEQRATGSGPDGRPWRVGVERPDAPSGAASALPGWIVALRDAAISTSGRQRNFFAAGGKRYSHVIDPRTGRPVDHALVSVSVIAREALLADGWSTALLVLGPDEGLRVAEREGLAALFVAERDGALESFATPAFERARVR